MKSFKIMKCVIADEQSVEDTDYILISKETGECFPELSYQDLKALSDFLNDYVKKEGKNYE